MKLLGRVVVNSSVYSSSLRHSFISVVAQWMMPACLISYWGASLLRFLSQFHRNASALKVLPSWNFTPWRNLKVHLVGSSLLISHDSASPGTKAGRVSPCDRSQRTSPS